LHGLDALGWIELRGMKALIGLDWVGLDGWIGLGGLDAYIKLDWVRMDKLDK